MKDSGHYPALPGDEVIPAAGCIMSHSTVGKGTNFSGTEQEWSKTEGWV